MVLVGKEKNPCEDTKGTELEFPSPGIVERLRQLLQVDVTPTQLITMAPGEIAQLAIDYYGGVLRVNVSAASEAEIDNIREAASVEITTESGLPQKAQIIITGDISPEGWFDSEETTILRLIDRKLLGDEEGADTIGRRAFGRYIEDLFRDPAKSGLVQEEWNTFIVRHPHTGSVDSPYETHHFHNVGLRTASEGEDPLRGRVIDFVLGVMGGVSEEVEAVFESGGFMSHSTPAMNTRESRLLALGMAEWSNFVRGAAYYRIRRGEESLETYPPRLKAAQVIDQVTAEFTAEKFEAKE